MNRRGDLLRRLGYTVLGMNTVQMYLKVTGSRTPGHQENNNFCSVNLSLGPGNCEWFCVDPKYWPQMAKMCQARGLDFLTESWWPDLADLARAKIPVIRFEQRPGEVVFVNYGCVHWVQALSRCTNVAWNVGPTTLEQFSMAWERQEYLQSLGQRSLVPMEYLTWQLASMGKGKIKNPQLMMVVSVVTPFALTETEQA